MVRSVKAGLFLASLAYPFVVYWGLNQGLHFWLIVLLFLLLIGRCWVAQTAKERWVVIGLAMVVLAVVLMVGKEYGLKLYPVMINVSLLALFGLSLFSSMPIVERMARLTDANLPPHAVIYTRRVTQVWCLFFAINGSISLFTVFAKNGDFWLLYNGVIAYVLIAIMMAGEWLIRQQVRKRDV